MSEMLQFVKGLFNSGCEQNGSNIRIIMEDKTPCNITFIEDNGVVTVFMNDQNMGRFEKMTRRGYDYIFYQKYRCGMKKNGTTNCEKMIVSICEKNPLILFNPA